MERYAIIFPPIVFLSNLLISEYILKKRRIYISGKSPINKITFYTAKYLVIIVWAAMCLQAFTINYSIPKNNDIIYWASIFLWFLGFTGLFFGKSTLGKSFRYGTPLELTIFRTTGLYRISRNPMYVSLALTLIASSLYTQYLAVLLLSVFIIITHHFIICEEERWLQSSFGKSYESYCKKVRRYI